MAQPEQPSHAKPHEKAEEMEISSLVAHGSDRVLFRHAGQRRYSTSGGSPGGFALPNKLKLEPCLWLDKY